MVYSPPGLGPNFPITRGNGLTVPTPSGLTSDSQRRVLGSVSPKHVFKTNPKFRPYLAWDTESLFLDQRGYFLSSPLGRRFGLPIGRKVGSQNLLHGHGRFSQGGPSFLARTGQDHTRADIRVAANGLFGQEQHAKSVARNSAKILSRPGKTAGPRLGAKSPWARCPARHQTGRVSRKRGPGLHPETLFPHNRASRANPPKSTNLTRNRDSLGSPNPKTGPTTRHPIFRKQGSHNFRVHNRRGPPTAGANLPRTGKRRVPC